MPASVVLDVRSPAEYQHACMPGAISLPLFTDEERKVVGTLYKQRSREEAIKSGLDFFGVKMKTMVEAVERIEGTQNKNLLIHCWRGGMRSAAVAWLLDLYGFKVFTLVGGYKSFRKWVLERFEIAYPFKILGGYTGSGKTDILHLLNKKGALVIDLEALACHKGSAFGGFRQAQPSQEMFENCLALELFRVSSHPDFADGVWLEDESQRIGHINIPAPLWRNMRSLIVFFLDIPFEERLNYLVMEYGRYTQEELVNAIIRIQKRLGGLDTKNAINYLLENNLKECFRILLKYYDKFYTKGLHNRTELTALLHQLPCEKVDASINTYQLLQAFKG